jgi:hypothetical protein
MVEHKTNVSETYLPVSFTTAEMKETASLQTSVLCATTLTLMMVTKQVSKTRSEVLKALQTFKTSAPVYQLPWCNIQKDMNQTAKTLVFGSTVSTLPKEMEQFSQTLVFSSSLPQVIVPAEMHAFIHHKCFKSHMNYLPYKKKRHT